MKVIVWGDGISLNFVRSDKVLKLKRGGVDMVAPAEWRSLLCLNCQEVEEKLIGAYLKGKSRVILVALPGGNRTGFVYEIAAIEELLKEVFGNEAYLTDFRIVNRGENQKSQIEVQVL